MLSKRRRLLSAFILFLVAVVGCSSLATRRKFYEPITAALRSGDFETVITRLEEANEKKRFAEKDRFLYFIDAGLANFYAGHYQIGADKLSLAERSSEELYTKSISRAAASLLLNDNALEYAGEDYEILYTNLIKTLSYLAMDDFDGAFVEVRRADLKLRLLEQKYVNATELWQKESKVDSERVKIEYRHKRIRFNNDAFARWLSMHMYAAEGYSDDAQIDYDRLHEAFLTQPLIYPFAPPQVRYQSRKGAILSVVALVGLAPLKESVTFRIRTDKDLHLVQILYTDTKGNEALFEQIPVDVKEDYYFKFAMPRIVVRPSIVSRIRISTDSLVLGELQLLEDVGLIAQESFEAKKTLIYIRSIARAIVKGLITHKLKKNADTGGVEGWFKKAAIDIGADITENADLRCSHLLPGLIYVGDFEIAPGRYNLTVEIFDRNDQLLRRRLLQDYEIHSNAFNLLTTVELN